MAVLVVQVTFLRLFLLAKHYFWGSVSPFSVSGEQGESFNSNEITSAAAENIV